MDLNVPGRNIQWNETSRDETSTGRNGNSTKHPAQIGINWFRCYHIDIYI